MAWHCPECSNVFDVVKKPRRCSECGERQLFTDDLDPREKGDDDGAEYGDPRDARAEAEDAQEYLDRRAGL